MEHHRRPHRVSKLDGNFESKAVKDNITESWLCIDCGRNTAPGIPDGPTSRRLLKKAGQKKHTIGIDAEVYVLRKEVWRRAGVQDWGGCLCIGCIEGPKRLGRKLTPKDFDWDNPYNGMPGTRRLLKRRRYTVIYRAVETSLVNRVIMREDWAEKVEMPWSKLRQFSPIEHNVSREHVQDL